jgi:hypothetical protein
MVTTLAPFMTIPTDAPSESEHKTKSNTALGVVSVFILVVVFVGCALYIFKNDERREKFLALFKRSPTAPKFKYEKLSLSEEDPNTVLESDDEENSSDDDIISDIGQKKVQKLIAVN